MRTLLLWLTLALLPSPAAAQLWPSPSRATSEIQVTVPQGGIRTILTAQGYKQLRAGCVTAGIKRPGCIEDVTHLAKLAAELHAAGNYLWYQADRVKPDKRKVWETGMRVISSDMKVIEVRLFQAHPKLRRFIGGKLWLI